MECAVRVDSLRAEISLSGPAEIRCLPGQNLKQLINNVALETLGWRSVKVVCTNGRHCLLMIVRLMICIWPRRDP